MRNALLRWSLPLLGACLGLGAWAMANQTATPPDLAWPMPCVSYDPFYALDTPDLSQPIQISAAQIKADMAHLAPFTDCVRVYTTQYGLDQIPALAAEHDLTVVLGVWLDNQNVPRSRADFAQGIELAQAHANVTHFVVGNEAIFFDRWVVSDLVNLMAEARTALPERVLVTTADMTHIWQALPQLAQNADVAMVHSFPFWAGDALHDAAALTLADYYKTRAITGLPVLLGEVGWASAGPQRDKAIPGRFEQSVFFREWSALAAQHNVWWNAIEAFDQPWKLQSQEGRAGAHFGLWRIDGTQKITPTGPVQSVHDWFLWGGAAALLGLLSSLFFVLRHPQARPSGIAWWVVCTQSWWGLSAVLARSMADEYLFSSPRLWLWVVPFWCILTLVAAHQLHESAEVLSDAPPLPKPKTLPLPANPPFVSIHIAAARENPAMLLQTLRAALLLDYPAFEVVLQVNNTTDENLLTPLWKGIKQIDDARLVVDYVPQVDGFKAGALNRALAVTSDKANLIALVDADYRVDAAWLRSIVGHFADAGVAAVQCPQAHFYDNTSPFQTWMHDELTSFFVIGMHQRAARNALIQHGTMCVIRRSALVAAGGWNADCLCEDAELGLRLLAAGDRIVYHGRIMGRGVLPGSFAAYEAQRRRWAYGAADILIKHTKTLTQPNKNLSWRQRLAFVAGWAPWLAESLYPFFLLLGAIGGIIIVLNPRFFPPPAYFIPMWSYAVLRLVSLILMHRKRTDWSWGRIVGALVAGASLTSAIATGVVRRLAGRRDPFAITHKSPNSARFAWQSLRRPDVFFTTVILLLAVIIVLQHGLHVTDARAWAAGALVLSIPGLSVIAVQVAVWRDTQKG